MLGRVIKMERELRHCHRCGVFNDPDREECKDCGRDITGDPVVTFGGD